MKLGAAIKHYRTFQGITQKELGALAGKSGADINYIERVGTTSLKGMSQIAIALGVPLTALILKATELEDIPEERREEFALYQQTILKAMQDTLFKKDFKEKAFKPRGRKPGGKNKVKKAKKKKPSKVVKTPKPKKEPKPKPPTIKERRAARDKKELEVIMLPKPVERKVTKSYAPRYCQEHDGVKYHRHDLVEFMNINERLTGKIVCFLQPGERSPSGKTYMYMVVCIEETSSGAFHDKVIERIRHYVPKQSSNNGNV